MCSGSASGVRLTVLVPPMRLGPDRRVLRQELLHTGFRRRQGRAFLPLRDELGVGEQLYQFLGNRERMRRIVARQHQARRLAARHERAVYAVDEARAVQVLVEGIQHLLGGLRVVLQRLGPRLEVAERLGGMAPTRPMACAITAQAMRWG